MASQERVEELLDLAEETIHRSYDRILDTQQLIEKGERVKRQIDRRLKIEGVFLFIAVASFLGSLAIRFG